MHVLIFNLAGTTTDPNLSRSRVITGINNHILIQLSRFRIPCAKVRRHKEKIFGELVPQL